MLTGHCEGVEGWQVTVQEAQGCEGSPWSQGQEGLSRDQGKIWNGGDEGAGGWVKRS